MSLFDATLASTLRAIVIALAAVCAAWTLHRRVNHMSASWRRWMFFGAALAYFSPTMLAGYGWLPWVVQWPAHSIAREAFYGGMLFLRLAPVAALAFWLAQPGPTSTARHVARLTGVSNLRWHWREAGSALWLAGGLVFLLAFQEFDLATSWGMRAWTVALFDAQIGGLALGDSLRLAALPFAIEVAVLLPLFRALQRRSVTLAARDTSTVSGVIPLAVYAIAPLIAFLILPASQILRLGADGFAAWIAAPTMLHEIGHAVLSGGIAAVFTWQAVGWMSPRFRLGFALPGLLGPLLLGLLFLSFLQFSPALSASVIPWLLALSAQLLPVALLLRLLLDRGINPAALHAAHLAQSREVVWTLRYTPALGAVLLLFAIAYSDFTLSALLAPPQFTTIFVRVFNLMHYGQSAILSVTVFVAVGLPLAVLGLTHLILRFYLRRRVRS